MSINDTKPSGAGIIFALLAYVFWGFVPLYWRFLGTAVDPLHILAFRILLSLIILTCVLLPQKKIEWLTVFKCPKKAAIRILLSFLICANWAIFVWAIIEGRTVEASLGYYINPLVTIVLGLLFMRERLRPLQWVAVGAATIGVLLLTILSGSVPWVALTLAFCFGFYGLVKKKYPLPALESLGAETLVAMPFALILLGFDFSGAAGASAVFTGLQGLAYLGGIGTFSIIALALCGAVTIFPLYCFAKSTRLLPLSTLGFMQFSSPTIIFILGVFVFGENFPLYYFIACLFIWTAVIIYIVSLKISISPSREK